MRICSLLPSTTEILCSLGLEENIVGITHECDYPPGIREKTTVVFSNIDHSSLSSREIDEIVTSNRREGKSTYLVDREKLKAANPDIIFTQGLCEICAVSGDTVQDAVNVLGHKPEIISLQPRTLEDILGTIHTAGEVTKTQEKAGSIVSDLESRINRVKDKLSNERDKPRVFCLEWMDPPYAAGHWVPQIVEYAGGVNGLAETAEPSSRVEWNDIIEFAPQVMLIMPCGHNIEKTMSEIDILLNNERWHQMPASRRGEVYVVDANSYFSRPGPRIAHGLEITARILHPHIFREDLPADSVLNLRNHMHLQSFLG